MGKPSDILAEKPSDQPPAPTPDTTVDDETEDLGVEEELEDEEDLEDEEGDLDEDE